MAQFQDLSTELVLAILELVLPEDIEAMSLVSKHIYQLAIPRLEEHRELRKEYFNFRNKVQYKAKHWHDPGGLLANLLCKIMTDTRLSHYVKNIDLSPWNSGARDGWKPDEVFEKQLTTNRTRPEHHSKTNMDIIEEAIRANDIIPTEEVDDWLRQIRLGNEDPLVALLFLYAPRFHTLKFMTPYVPREPSYFLRMIQRLAGQGSAAKPYASHFRNVEMYFADGWEGLDFVKAFMSLASLTSIKTESLFVDGRTHEASSAILPQPSNVTEIHFQSGFIPEQAMSELLQGVKNLKTFVYDLRHLWRDEDYKPPFNCLAVTNSLGATSSHTLESLMLSASNLETSQIAPIRGCGALREIGFRTTRCVAVENDITDLVSALPVSIEKLTMSWHEVTSVDGVETLTEAMLDLVLASKTRLPHLRILDLNTVDQGESDALYDCFISDDMAQINRLLAFNVQGPDSGGEIPAWADNVCTCGEDCFGIDSQ